MAANCQTITVFQPVIFKSQRLNLFPAAARSHQQAHPLVNTSSFIIFEQIIYQCKTPPLHCTKSTMYPGLSPIFH